MDPRDWDHEQRYRCQDCERQFITFEQTGVPAFWNAKYCPYCRSGNLEHVEAGKIPDFHECGSNPVTALDIQMKDGATLRLCLPDVQQSRVMAAIGRLAAQLDVPLEWDLPGKEGDESSDREGPG